MRESTERDTNLCDTRARGTAVSAPEIAAGPIEADEAERLPSPPFVEMRPLAQLLRFNQRQIEFVFGARRRLGDVFALRTPEPNHLVVTSLPDDVRSLFTAKPEDAPSLAAESPLRPIVGPDSVLTSLGERHMRQRKLLLPPFHGEAIERYAQMIADVDRTGDRQLAARHALLDRVADAGDHPRRDHGRDLRHRGRARRRARPRSGCGR